MCSSPDLHVPAYQQKVRSAVYKLYQTYILHKKVLLDQVDPQLYINSVLSAIENEKDPRNLIISYDLLFFILRNFASNPDDEAQKELIDPFLEDIFDKISCYYPINFVPPKNDKYHITP